MAEIAAAIERGIVGQANFLATLATAIFGGMVALRVQYQLNRNGRSVVRCTWAFWMAAGLVLPTIGIAFAVSGLLVELAPILFSFQFDTTTEFSRQEFCGNRIETLRYYSIGQVVVFVLFVLFAAIFVLGNVAKTSK